MPQNQLLFTLIFIITVGFALSTTWATPYTVTLDISFLIGPDMELELSLFDNDAVLGNSYVLIDKVSILNSSGMAIGPGLRDFEDGTLQGFDYSLNPASGEEANECVSEETRSHALTLSISVCWVPTLAPERTVELTLPNLRRYNP